MQHKKRKNRKLRKNQWLYRLLFVIGALAVVLISSYVVSVIKSAKPVILSPLARGVLSLTTTRSDPKVDLLKSLLTNSHIGYTSVNATRDGYVVQLDSKTKVILASQKDLKNQIASLQFILTRLTMESKPFSQLDLRFDKPVILFK